MLSHHLSTLSRGEYLLLAGYVAFVMALMWINVIFDSPSPLYRIKLEVVAFRAGWVSTVQLPLLFATALKVNPISTVTGVSYELMNWMHRWVARIMLITIFLHGFFFTYEWALSHIVLKQLKLMPMALWGFGAAGTISTMVVGGWRYVRLRHYEIWVVSHVLGAYGTLASIYAHTRCTTNFVAASMALLLFDAFGRAYLWSKNNLWPYLAMRGRIGPGGLAYLHQLDRNYLRVELHMPSLQWRPGQHIMLTVPSISRLQSHPFTISSPCEGEAPAVLIIKRCTGFTDRLWQLASSISTGPVHVLVSGPFGRPQYLAYESDAVVLVATGNRASYTYALLLDLLSNPGRTNMVHFIHIVRNQQAVSWYADHESRAKELASQARIPLTFSYHFTLPEEHAPEASVGLCTTLFQVGLDSSASSLGTQSFELQPANASHTLGPSLSEKEHESAAVVDASQMPSSAESRNPRVERMSRQSTDLDGDEEAFLSPNQSQEVFGFDYSCNNEFVHTSIASGRPSVDMILRPAIAEANGRVAVVAAVSDGLGAAVSQAVTQMSRELGIARGHSTSVQSLRMSLECRG